jgi:DNA-binding transcriptional ArsR family regulator
MVRRHLGAVAQHVRVLADAGLVSVRRDGRRRLYRARPEPPQHP